MDKSQPIEPSFVRDRRWIWIASNGLIGSFVMSMLMLLAYRSTAYIERIRSEFIPLIEINAALLRLNDSFEKEIELVILKRQVEGIDILEAHLSSMKDLQDELITKATSLLPEEDPARNLSREGLNLRQAQILESIRKENWHIASEERSNSSYIEESQKYLHELQIFSEDLAHHRDQIIDAELGEAKISYSLGVFIIISFLIFFLTIAWSFRRQIIAKAKAEAELETHRQLQIQSARMAALGQIASGIAHEINNPLAVILARGEMLLQSIDSDVSREKKFRSLDAIVRMAERISKIVIGMRSLARDSSQDSMQRANLVQIVEESLIIAEIRMKKSDVRLEANLDQVPKGSTLICRATQIEQVLVNLLSNAADAQENAEDRWIKLDYRIDGNFFVISVSDNGPGIAKEVRDKIMEPFFTTKASGKGSGLGLSISKRIIEEHGGRLTLEAAERPTTFCIWLPFAKTEECSGDQNPADLSKKTSTEKF